MKKRVLIVLAVVMLMFSMAACKGGNGESDVIGKWELTKMSGEGMEVDKETLKSMGMTMTVELKEVGLVALEIVDGRAHELSGLLVRAHGVHRVAEHGQGLKGDHHLIVFHIIANQHQYFFCHNEVSLFEDERGGPAWKENLRPGEASCQERLFQGEHVQKPRDDGLRLQIFQTGAVFPGAGVLVAGTAGQIQMDILMPRGRKPPAAAGGPQNGQGRRAHGNGEMPGREIGRAHV